MRWFALYGAACAVAVALMGAVAWSFLDTHARLAMLLSAGLAIAVQMVAFAVARLLRSRNVMLGWGLGSILRLLVLVVYAVVAAKFSRVPLAPALLTFVGFLFVTTVIEPVFLKR